MHKPRFTFCIPNLNKIEYLPACIESVLAQDCEDWRCVIVDGYSTDGSWEYLQQFASDPRFLIRRGIRQGMYADWNECLKHIETEYFYILTSDDTCAPGLVSRTTHVLDQFPDVDVCQFKYSLIDEAGNFVMSSDDSLKQDFSLFNDVREFPHRRSGLCEFIIHFFFGPTYRTITSVVFRSSLIPKMQGFKTIYGAIGDKDWGMRLGLYTDFIFFPEVLATWRVLDQQASRGIPPLTLSSAALAIASDNFDDFCETEHIYRLKQPLNKQQLLIEFMDCDAANLYLSIFNAKHPGDAWQTLRLAITKYPSYIPRKLVKRLTLNMLFAYPDRSMRARKYIESQGLDWPPQPINL